MGAALSDCQNTREPRYGFPFFSLLSPRTTSPASGEALKDRLATRLACNEVAAL